MVQNKKTTNPEEEVIKHKTNQRSTNKKAIHLKNLNKPKRTVLGCIDVYRFMTVEALATALNKSIGNNDLNM